MNSRKPRSDSKLASLSPEQKAQLRTWLVDENKPYEDVRELLRQDFNVRVSTGALSRFYATDCFVLRSSEAQSFAAEAVKQVKARENLDEATMLLIQQKAFEQAFARNGDLDALAVLSKILGDRKKLELKQGDQEIARGALELKVKQYEDKIAAARASLEKAKNKGGVSSETLQLIEQQLKLL